VAKTEQRASIVVTNARSKISGGTGLTIDLAPSEGRSRPFGYPDKGSTVPWLVGGSWQKGSLQALGHGEL
jgi:hypothetical protein